MHVTVFQMYLFLNIWDYKVKAWCRGPKTTHAKSTQKYTISFVNPFTIPTFALYLILKVHKFF